jgi:hypothetical protein
MTEHSPPRSPIPASGASSSAAVAAAVAAQLGVGARRPRTAIGGRRDPNGAPRTRSTSLDSRNDRSNRRHDVAAEAAAAVMGCRTDRMADVLARRDAAMRSVSLFELLSIYTGTIFFAIMRQKRPTYNRKLPNCIVTTKRAIQQMKVVFLAGTAQPYVSGWNDLRSVVSSQAVERRGPQRTESAMSTEMMQTREQSPVRMILTAKGI